MSFNLSNAFISATAAAVLALSAAAQAPTPAAPAEGQAGQQAQPAAQAPKKDWVDRAEWELVVGEAPNAASVEKTADPTKRLALLDQWTQKYPNTQFKMERLGMYLETYRQLGQAQKMMDTAKQIVALDPTNGPALSWINLLTVSMGVTSADAFATGEKAAQGLLANLDKIYETSKKPANVDDATWKKQRGESEALAQTTLGWIAMSKKDYEAAERELTKSLMAKPNNAQVSFWLGQVVLAQRKAEKQAPGLFHYARAASLDGNPPDTFPPAERKKIEAYVEKLYTTYHGDKTGFPELMALARANPLPPSDLVIKSKVEIANEKEKAFAESNPDLFAWIQMKKALVDDPAYFEQMNGKSLDKMKGKVVSVSPARRPTSVTVAIEKPDTPEITLKFDPALPNAAEPGTEIEFQGVASAFTKEPFNLTLDVDRENLTGWPAPAPAGKKSGGKKAAGKKR